VNRLKGVSEGAGEDVGLGVFVIVGSPVGEAVHVGGNTSLGVGVAVGISAAAGKVGGGNMFNCEYGSKKTMRNPATTHNTINKTRAVSTFHTIDETLRLGWDWS